MRTTFKPLVTIMTAASAACFTLAACTTEADEVAEVPVDESTVVDADAPAVGVPDPNGDADQVTAIPAESGGMGNGETTGAEDYEPVEESGDAPRM